MTSEREPRLSAPLIALCTATAAAAIAGVYVLWSSLNADFSVTDDHEPLRWMGRDDRLPLSRWWSVYWSDTEVGGLGSYRRWRPAYYAARVAQAGAFGDHPMGWHGAVLVLFITTCAVMGYVVALWFAVAIGGGRPVLGALVAAGSAITFAGMKAWGGLVAMLGPSEHLGLSACALALLAFTRLTLDVEARRWWWVALVASTVAVFSKESFAALTLAGPIVGAYRSHRTGDRSEAVRGWLVVLPSVVLATLLARVVGDGDVYGEPVGGARTTGALKSLTNGPNVVWWLAIVCLAASVTLLSEPLDRRTRLLGGLAVGWLAAMVIGDAWFYGGKFLPSRYRSVTDLFWTLTVLLAGCAAIAVLRRRGPDLVGLAVVGVTSIVVASFVLSSVGRVDNIAAATRQRVDQFAAYDRSLDDAGTWISESSDPVVMVVGSSSEYESSLSSIAALYHRDTTDRRWYLLVNANEKSPLIDTLRDISQRGDPTMRVQPIAELTSPALCLFVDQPPTAVGPCEADNSRTFSAPNA